MDAGNKSDILNWVTDFPTECFVVNVWDLNGVHGFDGKPFVSKINTYVIEIMKIPIARYGML